MPNIFLYQLNVSISQPLNVAFNDCIFKYFSNSSVNFEVILFVVCEICVAVVDIGSLLLNLDFYTHDVNIHLSYLYFIILSRYFHASQLTNF